MVCWLAIGLAGSAQAQVKTYNEEITVVAPFDPIIPDAFKISKNPTLDDTSATIPVMSYNIMQRIATVTPNIELLPAAKLVAEPLSKIYRNYIRAGAGNYSSLYGELFMSSLRSRQYHTSLRLKHQSAAGEIEDYGPPTNSRNEAEINASKYFQQHILTGNAFYLRDGLHLYGYKPADYPDTSIEKDDIKQRYQTIGVKANFASNYKAKDELNHSIGLSYYNLSGLNEAKENNFILSATLDQRYDLLNMEEDQVLGINAGYNFLNQQDSLGHINSNIFLLNPFIKAKYKEYSFMAGFKLNIATDSTTKTRFYPVLEARLELIPNALKLYAGIDGGLERASLQKITDQNLYVSSILPWEFVFDKFKIYGGFQSNISRSFNFNGSISSSSYENYPLFVTDTSSYLNNTFTLLYDNVNVVKMQAELEFIKTDRLMLAITGEYNLYKTDEQEYAWYKPAYQFGLSGRYDIQKKIIVTAKATVTGKVWALVPVPDPTLDIDEIGKSQYILEAQEINGWADINLGAEYRFNKALSFWLNFNNITNSKYYRWNNYRSYGINILGGVSYSF
jgi:hypothetical protein